MTEAIILLTLVYFSDGEPKTFIEPTSSMYECETWKASAISLANDNTRVDLVSAKCEEH